MSLKKLGCPNPQCLSPLLIKKDGTYFRRNDSRYIQRYCCRACGKKFSQSTHELECRQKKRRVNFPLLKLLCSGVSQRRAALLLRLNKNTVAKKFDYLAQKYAKKNQQWRAGLAHSSVWHLQFDDLITIEHTKLKPLTVTAAVNADTRELLSIQVGRIPAFGLLAKKSRAKYGRRPNQHRECLRRLFREVRPLLGAEVRVQSDEHQLYPQILKTLPQRVSHVAHKGGRGAVTGQGELKKLHYDPLFCINHTYAMLRQNVNRLMRKTWCTTKLPEKLQQHCELYLWFHNHVLLRA